MARFSERYGHVQPRSVIQVSDLDEDTRMAIWNVLVFLGDHFKSNSVGGMRMLALRRYYLEIEKADLSEYPNYDSQVWPWVGDRIRESPYFEVFDILETLISAGADAQLEISVWRAAPNLLNNVFEKYLVGYRVVGDQVVQIQEGEQVEAVERALQESTPPSSRRHLETALSLLASRDAPQYAKSIHESVSAVEAITRKLTGEQTMGAALKKLEAKGIKIHPALNRGWSNLYGWTSADGGIRHSSTGEEVTEPNQELALYFLVSCSAFVSYLAATAARTAGQPGA